MARLITVLGIVQGIGYRPFVARLASSLSIFGTVMNSGGIVVIHAEAKNEENLDEFEKRLISDQPKGANVIEIRSFDAKSTGADSFKIIPSNANPPENEIPLIPSDLPICDKCREELYDKNNRRYLYHFISCVACGPRYTIIRNLPYDRDSVTMDVFGMCLECHDEYTENDNRRRHAQTIACHDCGPFLILEYYPENIIKSDIEINFSCDQSHTKEMPAIKYKNKTSNNLYISIKTKTDTDTDTDTDSDTDTDKNIAYESDVNKKILLRHDALMKSIELLKSGNVIAIKGIGGYHFACLPTNKDAVQNLRNLKKRDKKPFAVMFPDIDSIKNYCGVNAREESLLLSTASPIVLLKKHPRKHVDSNCDNKSNSHGCNNNSNSYFYTKKELLSENIREEGHEFSYEVCGDSDLIGAFLPYTPLHLLLVNALGPLCMTSGNITDEPIIIKDEDILSINSRNLAGVIYNKREILTPLDDSVVRVVDGKDMMIRRSRGYVPLPMVINRNSTKTVLAMGSDLKSVFSFYKNDRIYPSQFFGDLENSKASQIYQENIFHMQKIFGLNPQIIVCDLHPNFISSKIANKITRHPFRNSQGNLQNCTFDFSDEYFDNKLRSDVKSQALRTLDSANEYFGNSLCSDVKSPAGKIEILYVQHHHAHAASVMAEHNISSCIGVVFDGTGYGLDKTIWGGEFLLCNNNEMHRVAHLENIKMCGGDNIAKNAILALQCYLLAKKDSFELSKIDINSNKISITAQRIMGILKSDDNKIIEAALSNSINTNLYSSMGRLFDAVSALLGIREENTYEGECAIMLEIAANNYLQNEMALENAANLDLHFDIKFNSKKAIVKQSDLVLDICEKLLLLENIENNSTLNCNNENNNTDETLNKWGINISNNDGSDGSDCNNSKNGYDNNDGSDGENGFDSIVSDVNNILDLQDCNSNADITGMLAYAFHVAIAEMVLQVCRFLRDEYHEDKVALTGGVFANALLTTLCNKLLEKEGFLVYHNEKIPCNDSGISVGQAWLASFDPRGEGTI